MPSVGVLGLGEAGGAVAADLVAAGCPVLGYDPVAPAGPGEVPRATSVAEAVRGADVVLCIVTAAAAPAVALEAAAELRPGQLYADLNTSSATLKRRLAAAIEPTGATFVDVALLEPVPGRGLRTRALASGSGSARFVALLAPLGMPVEDVGGEPGDAAALKLLRSVFMKGLAAAVLEALAGGRAAGAEAWVRDELLTVLDEATVARLVDGSHRHAVRRVEEMQAAAEQLEALGVEPRIARAAEAWLAELAARPAEPS